MDLILGVVIGFNIVGIILILIETQKGKDVPYKRVNIFIKITEADGCCNGYELRWICPYCLEEEITYTESKEGKLLLNCDRYKQDYNINWKYDYDA